MARQEMFYIGIDNGVTGYVSVLTSDGRVIYHGPIPCKKELSYTKTKQYITRLDVHAIRRLFVKFMGRTQPKCLLERPMVNPGRFKATASALRALEAILILLESMGYAYEYIDSRKWQRAMLPEGLKKDQLKKAAVNIAQRLFPGVKTKDADSLLMCEWFRRRINEKEPK